VKQLLTKCCKKRKYSFVEDDISCGEQSLAVGMRIGPSGTKARNRLLVMEEQHGMARRGNNLFKRNDVMRAIKRAEDAGLPVAGVEITCKDGTVIRVLGDSAGQMQTEHESDAAVNQWDDAIAKLKVEKPTKAKGR